MEIAALIIGLLALIVSVGTLVFVLAKHFSTHSVQMVPLEQELARGFEPPKAKDNRGPSLSLMDFEEPLDGDEENYFKQHNGAR